MQSTDHKHQQNQSLRRQHLYPELPVCSHFQWRLSLSPDKSSHSQLAQLLNFAIITKKKTYRRMRMRCMYSPFLWQALLLLPVSNTPGKKRQSNIILSDYSHSFVHLPQALKQSLMLLNTNLDLLPTQKIRQIKIYQL